jgi:hypothetical protein
MVTVDEYARIRRAHLIDKLSIRELARRFNHSRRKIREILAQAEPKPYQRRPMPSILDPLKPVIEAILQTDATAPPKQQHTAAKLYRRLRDEHGYAGGYDRVRRYVYGQTPPDGALRHQPLQRAPVRRFPEGNHQGLRGPHRRGAGPRSDRLPPTLLWPARANPDSGALFAGFGAAPGGAGSCQRLSPLAFAGRIRRTAEIVGAAARFQPRRQAVHPRAATVAGAPDRHGAACDRTQPHRNRFRRRSNSSACPPACSGHQRGGCALSSGATTGRGACCARAAAGPGPVQPIPILGREEP